MQCLLRPPETDRGDNYGNNRVQKKGAAIMELVHRLSSLRLLRPCPDMSIAPSMGAEYGFGEGSGDRIEGCLLLQGFCVLRNLPVVAPQSHDLVSKERGPPDGTLSFFFSCTLFHSFQPYPPPSLPHNHHISFSTWLVLSSRFSRYRSWRHVSGTGNLMEFGSTIEINYAQEGDEPYTEPRR